MKSIAEDIELSLVKLDTHHSRGEEYAPYYTSTTADMVLNLS